MKLARCVRENDVVQAITSGRSTDLFDPQLRSHVQTCNVCSEVAAVAGAMCDEYAAALNGVRVPSASLVWWRAELRLRRDSIRAAERPLTLVHAFASAASLGVLLGLLVRLSEWFRQLLAPVLSWSAESSATLLQQNLPLVVAIGAVFVLAPVALYLVFSDAGEWK